MLTLSITVLLIAALYFYLTRTFDYWTKRGVKHDKPVPLFGTHTKNFPYLLQTNDVGMAIDVYKKYPKERLVGSFGGSRPELVIRDPELAKHILIIDFKSFHRRGHSEWSPHEPLFQQIFAADGDLWHLLRVRTTPAFSSGKIKAMFPLVVQRAEKLEAWLRVNVSDNQVINAKDLMVRYIIEVISYIGFGVASDALNNDDDAMRKLGLKITTLNFRRSIIHTLKRLMPKLFARLKFYGHVEKEVFRMVHSVMKQRKYQSSGASGRHDFMDLLLECKKKGAMTGESLTEINADGTPKIVSIEMDDSIVVAQSFLFFAGGFETSSSVSSYTLHELARHPHAQEKVQAEIDTVLAKYDNRLCYDAISELRYLRWCLDETTRIFPPIGFLKRLSVHPYTFPETNVTIDAGVTVVIPIKAYHHDPEIFPEPQEFRPERFDPAVMSSKQKVAFIPFGAGPRACIGERLAVMQIMAGLAAVLSVCSVRPAPGTQGRPRTASLSAGIVKYQAGLPVIFQKRKY